MKKIVFILALVGLVGCGGTDHLGGPLEGQVSEPNKIVTGDGGPINDEVTTEEFSHLLNEGNVCEEKFEPIVLKSKSGKIDLGINNNGYRVLADFELYLFKDGTFISKYVEIEDREQAIYDGHGNLIPKPQRKKEIHGNWKNSGQNIVLPEIGMGYSLGKNEMSMELTFNESLITSSLFGKTIILKALDDSLSKKKVLCPEVYALGNFKEYKEYQNNSINGLEARDLYIDIYDSEKTWSFKVYLNEDNSFDVQYFVKPEKNHTVWGWEDGKWTREGNVLDLGDLAYLTLTGNGISITFKRPMNVEDALPKEFRKEFDQTGKEYSLDFTRGYL